jgi:hypothetical protein
VTVLAVLQVSAKERVRVAVERRPDGDRIDIRTATRLAAATDVWSPTRAGFTIGAALLPDLIRALRSAELATSIPPPAPA